MEETTAVSALFVWRRRNDKKQAQVQHLLFPSFLLTIMITTAAAAAPAHTK